MTKVMHILSFFGFLMVQFSSAATYLKLTSYDSADATCTGLPKYDLAIKLGSCVFDSTNSQYVKFGVNSITDSAKQITMNVFGSADCSDALTTVNVFPTPFIFDGSACNNGFKFATAAGVNFPGASGMIFSGYTDSADGEMSCMALDKNRLNQAELDFSILTYSTTCDTMTPLGVPEANGIEYVCKSNGLFTYNTYAGAACSSTATPAADLATNSKCTVAADFPMFSAVLNGASLSGKYRADCWNAKKGAVKIPKTATAKPTVTAKPTKV